MSRPGLVQAPGNLDNFLRGLITQPQQSVDSFFSGEVNALGALLFTRYNYEYTYTYVLRVGVHFRADHSPLLYRYNIDRPSSVVRYYIDIISIVRRPSSVLPAGGSDRRVVRRPNAQPLIRGARFCSQISNFLFKGTDAMGSDLLAMDIQRGRDMGIPPYTTMRTLCGLPPVNRFEDLTDVIDEQVS